MAQKLQDFIDIEQFQMLQDKLNEVCSFPSAIIDTEGKVLTATAWQDICTKFHRQNSECERECIKSDQYIADHLHEANPAVSYRCPHGLIDNATPIIIEGVHYGNFFTGQFFLEPPDLDFFKAQAKRYGFDETAYLEAVRKVPIWTREQLDHYLFFIKGLIEVIAASGLKNIREIETRKRIEESEERADAILAQIQEGFWITTPPSGKIVEVNEAFCKILGYSRDEILQMSVSDVEANDSQAEVERTVQQIMQNGSANFESRFRRKDGSIIDMDVSVTYLPKQNLFFGFHRDITKLRKSEKELKQNKQKLELTLRAAGAGTWDWDMATQRLDWSRELYSLFGLDPEGTRATFDTWDKVLHPEDKERAYDLIDLAIKEKIPLYSEYRVVHPGGTIRWINAIGNTVYDASGQAVRMVGICTDITERKRSEERLQEMTARLRLATDSAKAGVWDWNLQTNEMIWNERMYELYGLTHENFPGGIKAWEQGLHPEDSSRAIEECQAALRGEREFDTEFRVKHPDGNIVHIKASGLVLRDHEGKPLRMIGLNSDISDRRKAEEERREFLERLQRAEKMESLGTLAGGVAHDLNNVLGIIVGYAELVLEGMDKSAPIRKSLENIMNGGLKAAAIVEDLLALARRGVQGREILNLNRLVYACQHSPEMVKLLSHHPLVKIETNIEPDLLNMSGSAVHLEKTLYNLISNASEVMPKGGKVTIKTANRYLDRPIQGYDHIDSGDYVVLAVSDTGEGISQKDLRRIFEPFYTKKIMGRSGTGLGLAVVWGTVKDHNGYINVQSEEGRGSTFTLYFPVTREEVTAGAAAIPAEEYQGNGESILVVDDVKEQRDLAVGLLTNLHYNASSVSSGEEAVEYLKKRNVDLVVLDMIMDPGMDGLDTYRRIISIHPKQKAIIVSGFSESDRVKKARSLGAGSYVRKPYMKEKLGVAVKAELDRK